MRHDDHRAPLRGTGRAPAPAWLLAALLALPACGSRSLGGDEDPDARVDDPPRGDAAVPGDAAPPTGCDAFEARLPPDVRCGDPTPIGWTWTGQACEGIPCVCEGADCGRLYASEALCYADKAPACLPPSECQNLDYQACQDRPDCRIEWYGGGCIDLDTCEPGGPSDGNWLCWEQGIACVPADHPCNQRARGECDGDCYWWEHRVEACFGDMGTGNCCIEETYGYCAPLPSYPPGCEAQQITGCSDPCVNVVGYHWDGAFCAPTICCCEGPDCDETYPTLEACLAAREPCLENACGEAGGYCAWGDYVPEACREGYGADWYAIQGQPEACGLGVCCTPCPDPADPRVGYVSHDPTECQQIDYDCFDPNTRHFDNECGCGCITE